MGWGVRTRGVWFQPKERGRNRREEKPKQARQEVQRWKQRQGKTGGFK